MDTPTPPDQSNGNLTWSHVGVAFCFIVFDATVSRTFSLGLGTTLVTAAIRCVVQLTVVALVLQKVFDADDPLAVAGIACLLNLMGATETVVTQTKRRYRNMFPTVLIGMLGSTIPVSVIGNRFSMVVEPFWKPNQYIPVVGMLCGNAISGIVVAVSYVLKEIDENRDKLEVYLAFGASRFEASKQIATEALRLALTPMINQMSVIGIICIPGTMTGAILGGSSVQQAARLQIIIMFMISSVTALSSILSTIFALVSVVDTEHRIRSDRIDNRPHAVWRARNRLIETVVVGSRAVGGRVAGLFKRKHDDEAGNGEHSRLLG